jgi:hypothetical protein
VTEYAATYIAANQFSVEDDKTNFFHLTEIIRIEDNGTYKYSSINDVDFGDGLTTVTITQSILVGPCGNVEPSGIWSGPTGNTPAHTHEDDNTGGSGIKGSPPLHEWNGTELRFKQTDGSWGDWTDLGGAEWFTGYDDPPSDELGEDGDCYLVVEGSS